MSDYQAANDELPRASEAEALESLRKFALGPIGHIFTWSEAATVLELIETLTKSGIIEVSVRNPSIAEYMAHWEGRAERAEAIQTGIRKAIEQLEVALSIEAQGGPRKPVDDAWDAIDDILAPLS